MTHHDFQPGSTWIYGPVDSPTYVRLLNRTGGLFWSAISGDRTILFDPTLHPDIRKAIVVGTYELVIGGASVVEAYLADPLRTAGDSQ